MRPKTVSWISSAPGRMRIRTWVTVSLRSSFLSARPGLGVAAADASFPLKLVSVANVVPRRLPPVSVRSTTVLLLSSFPPAILLIGFHFLDLDVAVVIASSDSVVDSFSLNSSFLALAITSSRLPPLEPDSESLGSDFVRCGARVRGTVCHIPNPRAGPSFSFFCTNSYIRRSRDVTRREPQHHTNRQNRQKHRHHGGRAALLSSDVELMDQRDPTCGRPVHGVGRGRG